ncbi:MAG: hypothetical protein LBP41_00660 [Holosporaceae bacterium]|nr:hypothetical protein [Holosporaceae bacterium]
MEFSFSVPLLIMVMFFALDVPLAYRISSKLQKTSELYAQILLNTIERKPSRNLTEKDLINISRAIGLTFTGVVGSATKPNNQYPFYLSTYITCLKCDKTTGNFVIKWNMHIQNDLKTGKISSQANDYAYSINIANKSITSFSGSLGSFKTYQGELKLTVETIAWHDGIGRGFNQKFYLLSIPGKIKSGNNSKILGDRYAVITPRETVNLESLPFGSQADDDYYF